MIIEFGKLLVNFILTYLFAFCVFSIGLKDLAVPLTILNCWFLSISLLLIIAQAENLSQTS